MTSDTQNLRDAEWLKRRLIEICEANPARINPRKGHACLYSTAGNPEDNCLIGWLAREEGWTVPPEDCTESAFTVARDFGWPVTEDGASFLVTAQAYADGFALSDDVPVLVAWGEIVNDLKGLAT